MLKRNSRITLYANSGRISLKRLEDILTQHIDSRNINCAVKALNEYKQNVAYIERLQHSKIDQWSNDIKTLIAEENDVKQYKKTLNKNSF